MTDATGPLVAGLFKKGGESRMEGSAEASIQRGGGMYEEAVDEPGMGLGGGLPRCRKDNDCMAMQSLFVATSGLGWSFAQA